ncbi:MAG: signal recognition particle-docking protein FtsY [Chloroflexota bacterium]|nr:signal recognition particle-docking protein FtsY [Anaerolineae bacterium]HMM28115.1 signal recognition particle-docking protein FtsY [Aggregatilineaceae bacterium]
MGSLRKGLSRTRQSFFGRIAQAFGATDIDEDTWDDVEALLIQADVGVATTTRLVERMKDRVWRDGITRQDQLTEALKDELRKLLTEPAPLNLSGRELSVMLIAGVNGSGKTTTIGKIAYRMRLNNRKVIIAAGDTFRAAAIDQLKLWGDRAGVPVIAGLPNSDPAAVVYDSINAARARHAEVLIVDTAGRLHSNFNLMAELVKVRDVLRKVIPDAPHETLLVLDGTTGQNALTQAKKFQEAIDVTGVVVTKLDSTAKGGMLFAIQQELGLPIHYVGIGESVYDLVFFNPAKFVDSLFENGNDEE